MIPPTLLKKGAQWDGLEPDQKRRHLLEIAHDVFAEQGLDAPMPAVAAAAGVGVGSLYRCIGSKEALLAAIVVERMTEAADEIRAAHDEPDAASGLERLIRELAELQITDHMLAAALEASFGRPEVEAAIDDVRVAWQPLIDGARRQGRIRNDATALDLTLTFAATRSVVKFGREAQERMLELSLDALGIG